MKQRFSRSLTPEQMLLQQWLAPDIKRLRWAWLSATLGVVCFIGQAYALAQLFAAWLLQSFSGQHIHVALWFKWLPVLAITSLLRPVCHSIRMQLGFQAANAVQRRIRQLLLTGLAQLGGSSQYFGNDGELSSRLTDQIDRLEGYISRFYVQKILVVSTPCLLLMVSAWQSWVVALIFCSTLPLLVLFMVLIGSLTARQSTAQLNALAQLSGRFLDWMRGLATVQRLQATALVEHDIAQSAQHYQKRTLKVLRLAFLNHAVLELMASISIALVAVYLGFGLLGILPWAKNSVPVDFAGALFLLLLAPEFYATLRQLGADYHAKGQAESVAGSLLPLWEAMQAAPDVFRQPEQTVNRPLIANNPPEIIAENITILGAEQRIRLANFNAYIRAGSRVLITGASGSGKSSVLQMLLGFASFSGSLNIDGQAFEQVDLDNWRNQIGYLAQNATFLPDTIAANLRLAAPQASDAELLAALEAVELGGLVQRLPQGLDTLLGEQGRGLSGGQLQRLALAQLLLRPSCVWLLDELTEHLDTETAMRLHCLLERLSRGKTVLWVTHQVAELTWFDAIIRLPENQNGVV